MDSNKSTISNHWGWYLHVTDTFHTVVNDFDRIASFYDSLVRLVFGKKIKQATLSHLGLISKQDSILIIGGGTGWILENLSECNRIIFLDKSKKMLRLAKQQEHLETVYLKEDFLNFKTKERFDVVICPFFLDCFNETNLLVAIKQLKTYLRPDGSLIVVDFQQGNKKWLISTMLVFFRIFVNLEARKLLDIHRYIQSGGFQVEKESFFNRKMIFSRVYRNL